LLQTFLVGQPEFRHMLQGPGMLQLRQRVTAQCHLGPLDEKDTRAYIEHRLKCAGATDKPTFDEAVFHEIFQHSGGIPRRINALCDRLMLQGYLLENPHFTASAMQDVVDELQAENNTPASQVSGHFTPSSTEPWLDDASHGHASALQPHADRLGLADIGDIDPSDLELDPKLVDGVNELLTRMSAEQISVRLQRIERSLLRQERISLEIVSALKKIANAGRKRPASEPVPQGPIAAADPSATP